MSFIGAGWQFFLPLDRAELMLHVGDCIDLKYRNISLKNKKCSEFEAEYVMFYE